MLSHIRTIPEISLLGPLSKTTKRVPTMCFLVRHPRGTYLHHRYTSYTIWSYIYIYIFHNMLKTFFLYRFVVAVLNDVFGIQATAHTTLVEAMSISQKLAVEYERLMANDDTQLQCMQPGYTQITLPFFMGDPEVAFILEAMKMVATEAWKLLPQYEIDNQTGEWRHHSNSLVKERKWLGAIRYTDGRMLFNDRRISGLGVFPQNYADCLQTARNLFNRARKIAQRSTSADGIVLRMKRDDAEALRWYILPGEAHELLLGHSQNVKNMVPFDPNKCEFVFSLSSNIHIIVKCMLSTHSPRTTVALQHVPSPQPLSAGRASLQESQCANLAHSLAYQTTTIQSQPDQTKSYSRASRVPSHSAHLAQQHRTIHSTANLSTNASQFLRGRWGDHSAHAELVLVRSGIAETKQVTNQITIALIRMSAFWFLGTHFAARL